MFSILNKINYDIAYQVIELVRRWKEEDIVYLEGMCLNMNAITYYYCSYWRYGMHCVSLATLFRDYDIKHTKSMTHIYYFMCIL